MRTPEEAEYQRAAVAGQIYNHANGKFVTYFTSIPDGYLESMDIQVCDTAPSFQWVRNQNRKTADSFAAEGDRINTLCLERVSWQKMMDTVLVDVDEAYSLSEQTRERMKKKARIRFGDAVKRCLRPEGS